jgi:hypothetical protein
MKGRGGWKSAWLMLSPQSNLHNPLDLPNKQREEIETDPIPGSSLAWGHASKKA